MRFIFTNARLFMKFAKIKSHKNLYPYSILNHLCECVGITGGKCVGITGGKCVGVTGGKCVGVTSGM